VSDTQEELSPQRHAARLAREKTNELRRRIDLRAVAAQLGVDFNGDNATCPFHDDHTPSLGTFVGENGIPRYSCFVCGYYPDVFDFVQRLTGCAFADAVEYVSAGKFPTVAHRRVRRPRRDFRADLEKLEADEDVVDALLAFKRLPIPAEWLITEFRLRTREVLSIVNVHVNEARIQRSREVLIPHWRADGSCRAVKTRCETGAEWQKPVSEYGSTLHVLYGEWRDRGQPSALVVEGESDTWSAAWLLRDEPWDVFGLPSGASAQIKPAWRDQLRDRNVVVMFDADDAGRKAAHRWAAE
jgi:hypothetical protein